MKEKLVEPMSRKLMHLGRSYLNLLARQMGHLDINRYYYALSYISYHDGQLTQQALAKELGKDKSVIVSIIDSLSKQGYVFREINPADRREHLLRVTEKAKKEVPQIVEAFEALNKNITANISDNDLNIFNDVLVKMENNLKPLPAKESNLKQTPQ